MSAPAARGEVTMSLPLRGYFRASRFVPVRLQVHEVNTTLTVTAPGAVPTEYRASGFADVIVPWLPLLGSTPAPRISGAAGPGATLHPLSDDERLVALAGEESQNARFLFPDKRVITIPLDLSRPLLEPALAWEGIDGVMLSAAAAKQLPTGQIETLASAGVVLAIRQTSPPDTRWPWKREGDFWVVRHQPSGPQDVIEAAGYTPTYDWYRGWPTTFRKPLLLAALVFVMLAVGVSLWRSRVTVLAVIAVCALSAGLLVWWYSRQSPVLELSGGVMVAGGSLSQVDVWHWRSPLRPADGTFPVDGDGLTYPILPDARHAAVTGLRLICRGDGRPQRFEYHLEPQQTLAFLNRMIRTDISLPPLGPAREPFNRFADDLYLAGGDRIQGQFVATDPVSGQSVPLVVIDHAVRD